MSDHREAIAKWFHTQLCVGMTTASAEPCTSCYGDADALLGSDALAQIRAEARAEALREAAEFIEVTAGIGTNDSTYADGWYAALGYALDELRDRAEGSV